MTRFDFSFVSDTDSEAIHASSWGHEKDVKGVVLIAHGMGEHGLRYERFAKALGEHGFASYAIDHRGHGRSVLGGTNLGDFGEPGWQGLVQDVLTLTEHIRSKHPDVPVVLFGHSMGSFAAQQICLDHSHNYNAVILSGSTCQDKIVEMVLSEDTDFSLADLNATIENPRTGFDWLSRDADEVDKYVDDPLCGFDLTSESIGGLLEASVHLADPKRIENIREDLPVLLVAGSADPLNGNFELLKLLEQRWRDGGVKKIESQFYQGGRHEMLNETNRDEVASAMIDWIKEVI